jgi:hypothetical protein
MLDRLQTTPPEPLRQIYYAVLDTELSTDIWMCGILDSHHMESLVHQDGSLWRIQLSNEDAQIYLAGFKDHKQLQYNAATQELSLVEVE